MRLMGIEDKGSFREFKKIPFDISHEEKLLEDWIENNPASLLDDQALLPIGRQVLTNLGSYIDLLCLDREGNAVVVELKRDRTPRDTLAQALEYASFIADLDSDQMESILRTYTNDEVTSLAEYHRESFKLETNEAVAFNKRQSIVIVGQNVTREIRQTSNFFYN
jgi:RecB family endonuclease NucS